jgi:endonuclease YncB( thermonuclease family)
MWELPDIQPGLLPFVTILLLMAIGLISPEMLSRLLKRRKFKDRTQVFSEGLLAIAATILVVIAGSINRPQEPIPEPNPEVMGEHTTPTGREAVIVTTVTDGDTFGFETNGTKRKVRIIGMDSPEMTDKDTRIKCLANLAKDRLTLLISGQTVWLEIDPSQGELDRYQRLLRNVYLETGENVAEIMIQEGLAYEYTYNKPYLHQSLYRQAEITAKDNQQGMWGTACLETP